MNTSNGNGEKKPKKPGLAATITAVAALLASVGTLVQDILGQREQDLVQESVFNYATAETAAVRERLARLETHVEWLRSEPVEAMAPAMVTQPGCAMDEDCGVTERCMDGECLEPGGAGGGVGAGGAEGFGSLSARVKPKLDKFKDLKGFVQTEQRAWVD